MPSTPTLRDVNNSFYQAVRPAYTDDIRGQIATIVGDSHPRNRYQRRTHLPGQNNERAVLVRYSANPRARLDQSINHYGAATATTVASLCLGTIETEPLVPIIDVRATPTADVDTSFDLHCYMGEPLATEARRLTYAAHFLIKAFGENWDEKQLYTMADNVGKGNIVPLLKHPPVGDIRVTLGTIGVNTLDYMGTIRTQLQQYVLPFGALALEKTGARQTTCSTQAL